MLTILEGPDGAGKTTLAEALVERFSINHLDHHGAYVGEKNIARHYMYTVSQAWEHQVLMDRCWLAEPIYGKTYRKGKNRIGPYKRMLERLALSTQTAMILCLPDIHVCIDNWTSRRAQEYLDHEFQLRDVYKGYTDLMEGKTGTDLHTVRYDYRREESSPEQIWALANEIRPKKNDGPGIGHWNPGYSILIVGGQATGQRGFGFPGISFNDGIEVWLAKEMDKADISERCLYWVNSINARQEPQNPAFIRQLRPKLVIALGESAHEWCEPRVREIELQVVDSPEYWKHYHDQRPYPFIDIIKKAQKTAYRKDTAS